MPSEANCHLPHLRFRFASVKWASSIGAVYLGIYLILPACLCQFLAAFGLSLHASTASGDDCTVAGQSLGVVCHCEDHVDKSAEAETPGIELSARIDVSDSGMPGAESVGDRDHATGSPPVRGPPSPSLHGHHRCFSGVFLI